MGAYDGKKVLITGGSAGIGLALAKRFASQGACVGIVARNPERLEAARQEIEAVAASPTQRIAAWSVDVTDRAAVAGLPGDVLPALGGLDILVNNAGYARAATVSEQPVDDFAALLETNYLSGVYVTRAFLPHFQRRQSGAIVMVSSMLGWMSMYGYGAYSASKHAICGFAGALRQELLPYGVHVGLVYPPATDTPGLEKENEDKPPIAWALEKTAKIWSAEEVADAILQGIERRRYLTHVGFEGKLFHLISRWFPGLFNWILDRMYLAERRRQADGEEQALPKAS